ncbi:hypothetical protein AaE_005065, partial [Aphanomyces astaci]
MYLKQSKLGIPARFLFVSDRCKGANVSYWLTNAIRIEFPESWHRFCMYHVFNNIRAKKIAVNDLDKTTIYGVADARSKDAFKSSMLTLKANLPRAYQYLVDIQPGSEGWVQ